MVFGLLMLVEVGRYMFFGWVEHYYLTPAFHFPYPGLEFVRPWPGAGMFIHFAVLGLLAAGLPELPPLSAVLSPCSAGYSRLSA